MSERFWIDERTGLVHKVPELWVSPEEARLRKKRLVEAKARRDAAKQSRRRNRRG